mgnify:CR=1 FL=1
MNAIDILITVVPTVGLALTVLYRGFKVSLKVDKHIKNGSGMSCFLCARGVRAVHSILILTVMFILIQFYWYLTMMQSHYYKTMAHWLWWMFDIGVMLTFLLFVGCFDQLMEDSDG